MRFVISYYLKISTELVFYLTHDYIVNKKLLKI